MRTTIASLPRRCHGKNLDQLCQRKKTMNYGNGLAGRIFRMQLAVETDERRNCRCDSARLFMSWCSEKFASGLFVQVISQRVDGNIVLGAIVLLSFTAAPKIIGKGVRRCVHFDTPLICGVSIYRVRDIAKRRVLPDIYVNDTKDLNTVEVNDWL